MFMQSLTRWCYNRQGFCSEVVGSVARANGADSYQVYPDPPPIFVYRYHFRNALAFAVGDERSLQNINDLAQRGIAAWKQYQAEGRLTREDLTKTDEKSCEKFDNLARLLREAYTCLSIAL